jgi:hypothetical protein
MNTLKVTLTSAKELKDEKGRGLEEGKHDIWCRTTLDSSGQTVETDIVPKCTTAWTGTEFNKKMSLCVDSVQLQPTCRQLHRADTLSCSAAQHAARTPLLPSAGEV